MGAGWGPRGSQPQCQTARVAEGENLVICKPRLLYSPCPLTLHFLWAELALWRGQGGQADRAVVGGSHMSVQPCSEGGKVPPLLAFTLPGRDQRKGLCPGMGPAPPVLLAVGDPRKDFQRHLMSPPCFQERCAVLGRECLTHLRDHSPWPSAGIR